MNNIKFLFACSLVGTLLFSCGGNDTSEKGSDLTNNQPSDTIINNDERPFSDTVNMSTAGSSTSATSGNTGGTTTITTGGTGAQQGSGVGSTNGKSTNSTTGGK